MEMTSETDRRELRILSPVVVRSIRDEPERQPDCEERLSFRDQLEVFPHDMQDAAEVQTQQWSQEQEDKDFRRLVWPLLFERANGYWIAEVLGKEPAGKAIVDRFKSLYGRRYTWKLMDRKRDLLNKISQEP